VVVVGVADRDAVASFKPQELFFKELTIRGTKGVTYGIDRALRWLGALDLESVITHTLPLAQAREAVELALTGEAGKVYLTPAASATRRRSTSCSRCSTASLDRWTYWSTTWRPASARDPRR